MQKSTNRLTFLKFNNLLDLQNMISLNNYLYSIKEFENTWSSWACYFAIDAIH